MIIYIDENMPAVLAEGFDLLQGPENVRWQLKKPIRVKSIKRVFGQGAKDEEWIPSIGNEGGCIITQDYNINRIKHQRVLCEQYKLGMIYFRPPSKNGFTYWEMLQLLVKHWQQIIKIATKEKRPFAYRISARSSRPEKM